MSALPLRQQQVQHTILKLANSSFAIDPYHDRLASQGYTVIDGTTYENALALAHRHHPELIILYDDPESGIDARRWLELQHYDRFPWMATTPLLILVDSSRVESLRVEELPDRVILLQRRADTLNQLTRMVKYLLRAWDLDEINRA